MIPAFDNGLLVMRGWGYITCLRTLKEWLSYKMSLKSPLCPIFGSFLSYSLQGITDVGEMKD